MVKYRKRPVVVRAVQWTGDNRKEVWDTLALEPGRVFFPTEMRPDVLFVKTLEGVMEARVGDWIIEGVAGELYPCKPEIFLATYEEVED